MSIASSARVQPECSRHGFPLLGGKAPLQAGSPVLGDEGRLDGDRAGAAEGVAERIPPPVAGEQHQRRRQGFPQRRAQILGPVAPLVEPLAGGVQVERRGVLDDGELNLIPPPGLRQRLPAIGPAQPLRRRFFHNRLAGGNEWSLEFKE